MGPAGAGALSVVDNAGRLVAAAIGTEREPTFVMTIGEAAHYIDLTPTGFHETGVTFYYESFDCSGQRLLLGTPGRLIRETSIVSGMMFYPVGTIAFTEIGSIETYNPGANLSARGTCAGLEFAAPAGIAGWYDLSTLGFTPPFRVQ
jgi:hypothetical protein